MDEVTFLKRFIEKYSILLFLVMGSFFLPLYSNLTIPQVPSHPKIILRGSDGGPLTLESKIPFSPKKTCGACHDYDRITRGYHFQQGRMDGSGNILVSDSYAPRYSWNLSSGMYGKVQMASSDPSQLAKKNNLHPSEIDKSSFYFVQNRGSCHPAGGWSKYDRRGSLAYTDENKTTGRAHV